MNTIKKLTILCFLSAIFINVNAQSVLDTYTIEIEITPYDFDMPGLDTLYALKCIVETTNADSIQTLNIKIGTEEGGGDIFSHVFQNADSQTLPDGSSFIRNENSFFILVKDDFYFNYFYEVILEDISGNLSEPQRINL